MTSKTLKMGTVVQNKINTFKRTFKGRQDIVPRLWISKDGKKTGWAP